MILYEKDNNMKLNMEVKEIIDILVKNKFELEWDLDRLDTYLIPKDVNVEFLNDFKKADNYAIFEKNNNSHNNLILKRNGNLVGNVKGANLDNDLLDSLKFKEIMKLDKKIYKYIYNNEDIIVITDIKDQGVYLEIKFNEKHDNLEKCIEYLKKLGIIIYEDNLIIDDENEALKNLHLKLKI